MALKEIIARFGIKVEGGAQLAKTGTAVQFLTKSLGALGVSFGVLAGLRAIRNVVRDQIELGDELDKTSQVLGINSKALQQWRHAADLSGVGQAELNSGLQKFSKNIFEASKGTALQAEAFEDLGVKIRDGVGGPLKEAGPLLYETIVALSGLESQTEKAGQANRLFGRSGAKLMPLLNLTEEQLKSTLAELDVYGGGIDAVSIKTGALAKDAIARFNLSLTSIRSSIAVLVLPALTWLLEGLAKLGGWFSRTVKHSNVLQGVLAALAVGLRRGLVAGLVYLLGLASRVFPTLLGWALRLLPAFLKFAAVALIFDDIITFVKGGNSVLGKMIDKVFGVGTAAKVVWRLHDVLKKVRDGKWSEAVDSLTDGLESMGGAIVKTIPWLDRLSETKPITVEDVTSVESWNKAIEDSKSPLQKFGDWVVAAGTTVGGWATSVGTAAGKVAAWFTTMVTAAGKWASDLAASALAAGASVVSGIIQGVMNGAARIKKAIVGVVKGAFSGLKNIIPVIGGGAPTPGGAPKPGATTPEAITRGGVGGKLGLGGGPNGTTTNFYGTRVELNNSNRINIPGAQSPRSTATALVGRLGRNDSTSLETAFNALVDA